MAVPTAPTGTLWTTMVVADGRKRWRSSSRYARSALMSVGLVSGSCWRLAGHGSTLPGAHNQGIWGISSLDAHQPKPRGLDTLMPLISQLPPQN